jgi:hypothetical protein
MIAATAMTAPLAAAIAIGQIALDVACTAALRGGVAGWDAIPASDPSVSV